MAGIILNGSVIKGLILNGSPVTAMLNGVKVFPTEEPSTGAVLINSENSIREGSWGNIFDSGSQLESQTNKKIVVIKIKLACNNTNSNSYIAFKTIGASGKLIWVGNAAGYGEYENAKYYVSTAGSSWNALSNETVGNDGVKSGNCFIPISPIDIRNNNDYKLIFDLANGTFLGMINGAAIIEASYSGFNPLAFLIGSTNVISAGPTEVWACDTLDEAKTV
jgi:hypothetical protein